MLIRVSNKDISTRLIDGDISSDRLYPQSSSNYIPPSASSAPKDTGVTDTEAILAAANYCKSSTFQWEEQALLRIGSRKKKWHFIVRGVDSDSNKECPMLLSLTSAKNFPLSLNNTATADVFANLVCRISHPFIQPCEDAEYIRDRNILVIVRKFVQKGSLKDVIYGKNPKGAYKDKYNGKGRPMDDSIIQLFGRQILEGLHALSNKGIVCDCLSTSNIIIDGQIARISDLELTLLGNGIQNDIADMLLKHQVMKDGPSCDIDVLLFGFSIIIFLLLIVLRVSFN